MELCELLTTLNMNQIKKVTYEGKDITNLLRFIIDNMVCYTTLDECNKDLNLICEYIKNEVINDIDFEEEAEQLQDVKNEYFDVFNEEVYTQEFQIVDVNKINLLLN